MVRSYPLPLVTGPFSGQRQVDETCFVPNLLSPRHHLLDPSDVEREIKLRERQSLVSAHQQSWWFTEMSQ